jgi:hypothetical protein
MRRRQLPPGQPIRGRYRCAPEGVPTSIRTGGIGCKNRRRKFQARFEGSGSPLPEQGGQALATSERIESASTEGGKILGVKINLSD